MYKFKTPEQVIVSETNWTYDSCPSNFSTWSGLIKPAMTAYMKQVLLDLFVISDDVEQALKKKEVIETLIENDVLTVVDLAKFSAIKQTFGNCQNFAKTEDGFTWSATLEDYGAHRPTLEELEEIKAEQEFIKSERIAFISWVRQMKAEGKNPRLHFYEWRERYGDEYFNHE